MVKPLTEEALRSLVHWRRYQQQGFRGSSIVDEGGIDYERFRGVR